MATNFSFLQDFDESASFHNRSNRLENAETHSFAVHFDAQRAYSTLNVSQHNVQALLDDRDTSTTLWINLWGWDHDHEQIVHQVAKHYGVSPRLAHFICPRSQAPASTEPPQQHNKHDSYLEEAKRIEIASSNSSQEIETLSTQQEPRAKEFLDVIDSLWHFCTVDFGRRYICIGWNALFFLPSTGLPAQTSKPSAIRIWSSLLLCDDGTLLSVFEAPPKDGTLVSQVRHNQMNVFRNLSRSHRSRSNALMQVLVRPLQPKTESTPAAAFEMASLLFYYLFDDWLNLFGQVSGGKHSYRHQLEGLRAEMTSKPQSEQVNTLHQVGRQLSALKSICRSYETIIERILHKQISRSRMHKGLLTRQETDRLDFQLYDTDTPDSTIRLSSSSVARFERLLDRIALCALTEVDECLGEKEALVLMNFNLISLKEAHSVERLTRTTILLAKVTIVFLPVSLATAYFSMQLKSIESYSIETYWLTFMVVALVTIALLVIFEFFANRYSGKIVYRSLTSIFFDRRRKPQ